MTTYYDYLRDRIQAAPPVSQAQLEQLIHAERNALWQQMIANPVYDERSRMTALSAFDEAASHIFSEQHARFGRNPEPTLNAATHERERERPQAEATEPPRTRSLTRDLFFLLLGAALGFAAAYFAREPLSRMLAGGGSAMALGVTGLTPSQKSYKFVRSQPSTLEGELTVNYASGTPPDTYACEVEATYRQILEYVKIDKDCGKVAFKFLPLRDLWANFNYLEGYMVFTTTVMSSSGGKWQGSASVYFSIDGAT